jgi:hypothetical protein
MNDERNTSEDMGFMCMEIVSDVTKMNQNTGRKINGKE